MLEYKELPDGRKVYNTDCITSRQTGTNAEIVLIVGAKNSGKTFNIRLLCIDDYLKSGRRFVEVSRTKDEQEDVASGYFDRIQSEGFYEGYIFKTDTRMGYIAPRPADEDEKPDWQVMCYFVSLTTFQRAKRRSNYVNVCNAIFDEFIIDKRDRYHNYLPDEFGLFGNLLNSVFRPFPNDGIRRNVFLMGNSCDLTCPYLRFYGVDKPPQFGFTFFKDKHVLLHYVAPWDVEANKRHTIIGRMMDGIDDASIFENLFDEGDTRTIMKKPSKARFKFGFVFQKQKLSIWSCMDDAEWYVCAGIPKGEKPVYALTKSDGTIDYTVVSRTEPLVKILVKFFYANGLRYDSIATREIFFTILDYLGIR